jgi:hypothetical protein
MKEDFLHHIWNKGAFNANDLHTHDGEKIRLLHKGYYHQDAGPDFTGATIEREGLKWHGNVEIHLKSSDWLKHGHQTDPTYESVILHVVWQHDRAIFYADGREIPTLELGVLVEPNYLKKYEDLSCNLNHIPCKGLINDLSQNLVQEQLKQDGIERLEQKSRQVLQLLQKHGNDWETVFRSMLFRSAGMRVNANPMEQLGALIDIRLVEKERQLEQTEALMFGISGLLKAVKHEDSYTRMLNERFTFLKHKYGLEPMLAGQWKYLRMRPYNFPDMRMAQMAALFTSYPRLFQHLRPLFGAEELKSILCHPCTDYWNNHYRLGEESGRHSAQMGERALDLLLINAIAPCLYAYGEKMANTEVRNRAIQLLEQLPPEQNKLSREWSNLGHSPQNALASQGILHRNNQFCKLRHCLKCKSGLAILEKYGRN